MKNLFVLVKIVLAYLLCFLAFLTPPFAFYSLWSWCMSQVSLTSEWAGVVKVIVTLFLLAIGGGATIVLAIIGGGVAATLGLSWLRK